MKNDRELPPPHTKAVIEAEYEKLSSGAREIVEDLEAMPYSEADKLTAMNYYQNRKICQGVDRMLEKVRGAAQSLVPVDWEGPE